MEAQLAQWLALSEKCAEAISFTHNAMCSYLWTYGNTTYEQTTLHIRDKTNTILLRTQLLTWAFISSNTATSEGDRSVSRALTARFASLCTSFHCSIVLAVLFASTPTVIPYTAAIAFFLWLRPGIWMDK